ncbi:hypothetical protein AC1031_021955 [Aphanomyces cochlioides]|nr:hypothetical protein AC1031_021955 [Aphanomyces cochlioides]
MKAIAVGHGVETNFLVDTKLNGRHAECAHGGLARSHAADINPKDPSENVTMAALRPSHRVLLTSIDARLGFILLDAAKDHDTSICLVKESLKDVPRPVVLPWTSIVQRVAFVLDVHLR